MNAKEARDLSYWNRLPRFVKEKIKNSIDNCGRNTTILHKTSHYSLIEEEIKDTVDLLRKLDYKVIRKSYCFVIFW